VFDFQAEKNLVRAYHDELAHATPNNVGDILARYVAPNWHWRGMHPFHEQIGPGAVADVFWKPFLGAMSGVQRRADIFMAGLNEIDGFEGRWVVQMGHLMALFDGPWLGILPTGKIVMLRFVEFNRVENDRIVETAMFVDLLHLMAQADQYPLPPQTGAGLVQPGPMTHQGLMYDLQDPMSGVRTLAAINAMLENPEAQIDGIDEAQRLKRAWHDDMIWWGPSGIGATYTIVRYIKQHCEPFDDGLHTGYKFNGHLCRMAEGHFGGFFGWANLTLFNSGGYLGMTKGPGPSEMRVVDLYREQDGKLAENWIFIDILHYLAVQGLDVLGRMQRIREY
jgi:SnoaL-like polyketide cyclase